MDENKIISTESYMRAYELDRSIKINAELMQKSLYEVCKGLKEMRDDKLYKALGYENFNDYCENEVGIKRVQAYNFIAIAEGLTENFVQSIEQIGTTKLTLLAKLDEAERTHVLENTDIESTTVKQLKQQIEDMKLTHDAGIQHHREEVDKLQRKINELVEDSAEQTELLEDKVSRIYELEELCDQKACYIDGLVDQLERAKKELEKLEKEPIDLTYTDADTEETRELRERISELERELEEEKRNVKTVPDRNEIYLALLGAARHSIGQLNQFAQNDHTLPFEVRNKVKAFHGLIMSEIVRTTAE